MILFQRVGKAFRGIQGREWALLSLETLGVIAGILIAFELNEWAARRNEAARHDRLMERLFEEIEFDVTVLRKDRDLLKGFVERERAFAVALGTGQCPADTDFEAATTVVLMPAMTVPSSVYQELIGAGGLSSIERKDVRDHLAEFHDTVNWSQAQIAQFRAIRINPVEESDPRVQIRFDPDAKDPEVWTFDRRALCGDQAFKNRVASATRNHSVYMAYFQDTLQDAITICVRLGDSLGKACTPPQGGPLKGKDAEFAQKAAEAMRQDLAKT